MPQTLSSVALVGSTGLVGSQILTTLLSLPTPPTVHALTRRDLSSNPNVHPLLEADNSKWPALLSSQSPPPTAFISALGTSRSAAGSVAAQRRIDLDLNLSLAQAAKDSGTKIYVLISSTGTSSNSMLAYSKMKGELEDAVKAIGFEHCVIVRPGLLVGSRQDTRIAEGGLRKLANGMGAISGGALKDFWAQDADVVGRAAVGAALRCASGERAGGVWNVEQGDVVRLGRTEWGREVKAEGTGGGDGGVT